MTELKFLLFLLKKPNTLDAELLLWLLKLTAISAALLRACDTPLFVRELHSVYETPRDLERAIPSVVDTIDLPPDALLLVRKKINVNGFFIT